MHNIPQFLRPGSDKFVTAVIASRAFCGEAISNFRDNETQRYYDLRTKPLQDGGGHFSGYLIVFRDITRRVLTEKALRQLDIELESGVNAELTRRNRGLLSLQSAAAASISRPTAIAWSGGVDTSTAGVSSTNWVNDDGSVTADP